MECPYCRKNMESGYIPNGQQPVQWIPDGEKPSMFSFSTSPKGITLCNKFSPLKANGYKAKAYYCSHCGIVLAQIENE